MLASPCLVWHGGALFGSRHHPHFFHAFRDSHVGHTGCCSIGEIGKRLPKSKVEMDWLRCRASFDSHVAPGIGLFDGESWLR